MNYPKRLIEVDLPIARISAHARREKSIRHGHISTLHIWWARRPLAACRAVTCAALWPDPADPNCPSAFREAAVRLITAFAKRVYPEKLTEESKQLQETASQESLARWEAIAAGTLTLDAKEPADMPMLRFCLLDFIADFANWKNSTVPAYLETSRLLTAFAHRSLSEPEFAPTKEEINAAVRDPQSILEAWPRPLVVDPFAGGGSIPLEALRVGADAFASDLNPVAVLLNKVVLEYIPKYGKRLADEVRKWGQWVKEQAEKELAEFYPKDADGATPIAYLWARTILSEAPGEDGLPLEVPMLRSFWLCKKSNRKIALRWKKDSEGRVICKTEDRTYANGATVNVRIPQLEVFEPAKISEVADGTVARGAVTCPVTGFTTPVESVRTQLISRQGGARDARMFAVVVSRTSAAGRYYRLPSGQDVYAIQAASRRFREIVREDANQLTALPNEELPLMSGVFNAPIYGHNTWGSLFSERQSVFLSTLSRIVRNLSQSNHFDLDEGLDVAVQSCLAITVNRQVDKQSALTRWDNTRENPQATFGRQALPMVWDFNEPNPFSGSGGDWDTALSWVLRVLKQESDSLEPNATVHIASAEDHPLPDESAAAVVTDPPYYNAVPYADLSDFFYVWLRRTLPNAKQVGFTAEVAPKDGEICEMAGWDPVRYPDKGKAFFENGMRAAMTQSRRIVEPAGVSVVVFAHSTTAGWEAMLQAMVEAGWIMTASWPIDTEMGNRLRARNSATLASSVHLVCRPRENRDGSLREEIGEWRDVLEELPKRIKEWMPRLASEGVVGADAIFACLGPALEIFSRYSRVEKASGEEVPLREYLEYVWGAISTEALSLIFDDADAAGLEPDARLTAMWLWTLGGMAKNGNGSQSENGEKVVASTGYTLEYDAARKISQGLGIHLEKGESIVEVKGDKARLLPVSERARHLFGKDGETEMTGKRRRKKKAVKQRSLFEELDAIEADAEVEIGEANKPNPGETVLDRVHQAMILFGAGRGEALRRFLVDDGVGSDGRFWKLAQSLSALYPKELDEKRWVDGVLARKKGLGL